MRRASDLVEKPKHLLLLRGLARHQKHWAGFDTRLAEALDVRVHHLDLPGFGTEHGIEPPTNIHDTMEHVRERWLVLLDEHPGAWGLVSISLGGMVAMAWSDHHPDDFLGQVIINSSAKNLGKPWERMQLTALRRVIRAMFARDPVARERFILEATSTNTPDVDAAAERSAAFESFAPMIRRHAVKQIAAATRYDAPANLYTPTLLLAAAGDRLASQVCSQRLAERTGAPLRIHPTSGHDLPRDAPEWIIDQMNEWFVDGRSKTE